MATDPSPNSSRSRGHVRKSTVVVPALPLALEKKGFGHKPQASLSRVAQSQQEFESSRAPTRADAISLPTEAASESEQTAKDVLDSLQPGDESQSIKDALALPPDWISTTSSAPAEPIKGSEQIPSVEAQESFKETIPDTGAGPSPDAAVVVEQVEEQQHVDLNSTTTLEIPAENRDNIAEVPGERKVQLPEEDTQPSDLEASSVQPSSTTGLTDYGSPSAEPSLETTVVSPTPPRDAHTHRKSEAAPEVLANGFVSTPTRSASATHRINGSQVISQPKLTPIPSIQDHLLYLASTKQYFDTVICVNHPDPVYQPSEHYGHSLLLTRSPDFAKLISEPEQPGQPQVISLYPARNILPHAFEAALRFFYSDHILTFQTLVPQGAYQDRQTKEQTLEYVMSYWFAGVELALLPIKNRSHEIMQQLIDWELADLVAKELQHLRAAEAKITGAYMQNEVRAIANSLCSLLARLYVTRLDLATFDLESSAQALHIRGRFAQLEYPRPSNPALAGMVFGSLKTEPQRKANAHTIASAVLLNLGFGDFERIAQELTTRHELVGNRIVCEAVQYRDAKRREVVGNPAVPNKQRLANSQLWDVAGWREYINEDGQLSRERVDFTLPGKRC